MSTFFAELKRRNVFKVGIAYVIVAWLLIQVADILLPTFQAPDWVMRVFTLFVILGFPLAIFLAWAYELTPEGIKPTESIVPEQSITKRTGQRLNYIIFGLMALAIVFLVIDNYVLNIGARDSGLGARKEKTTIASSNNVPVTSDEGPVTSDNTRQPPAPNTIAVLPFTDISPNKDQGYFADGLTEELLNKLAQVKGLEVTARTSSFYFKGKNEDMRTIGEMLGVAHLLEGSVRKSGNQLRITAQLINAADGNHLWSRTYDRELTDIFAIQDEIAGEVTTALSITLGAGVFNRPGSTRNVEAYDIFLQCLASFRKFTRDSILAAIDQCEQAGRLDPKFAWPWVIQWWSYYIATLSLPPSQTSGFPEKQASALERAQSLAPDDPYVLRIIATDHLDNHDWLEADQIYPALIEKYGYADIGVNMGYGQLLSMTGRVSEALQVLERAKRIDPLSADVSQTLAFALLAMGRLDDAIAESRRGQKLGGFESPLKNSEILAVLLKGNRNSAADLMADHFALEGTTPHESMLRLAQLLRAGDDAALLTEIQTLGSDATQPQLVKIFTEFFAAWLGQPQLALNIFNETGTLFGNFWHHAYGNMRRLPGFKDLVRKAGLVDYWRKTGHWADACHPVGEEDFECE